MKNEYTEIKKIDFPLENPRELGETLRLTINYSKKRGLEADFTPTVISATAEFSSVKFMLHEAFLTRLNPSLPRYNEKAVKTQTDAHLWGLKLREGKLWETFQRATNKLELRVSPSDFDRMLT